MVFVMWGYAGYQNEMSHEGALKPRVYVGARL
jgi:hypothetical protein